MGSKKSKTVLAAKISASHEDAVKIYTTIVYWHALYDIRNCFCLSYWGSVSIVGNDPNVTNG